MTCRSVGNLGEILKKIIYHGLITDARQCLHVLLSLSILAILFGSVILSDHMKETNDHEYQTGSKLVLYGNDFDSRLFLGAVAFTLIISIPSIIDMSTSLLYLQTWEELQQPIEYARLYLIFVLFVPNFFIYWHIIPAVLVDLVMFCQYLCIFYTLIYRIYSLSTAQQKKEPHIYPLRDLFIMCILTLIAAFCFKLSTHGIIGGRYIWKALYTSLLLLLQVITCFKLKPWFNFTSQISKVVKNPVLLQNKTAFFAVMIGIFSCTAMTVAHAATYQFEYVYFPKTSKAYIVLEWLFCAVLVFWTSIRNFEMRKAEMVTANQLAYNRKMTRSISHEIRTPLNTAFMALELLITSLTQQQGESIRTISSSIDEGDVVRKSSSESKRVGPQDLSSPTTNLLEIAESIKEGCDIALNILNQLLTFEKLSAGMLQLENKVITVNELLDSNMKLFRMQAQQCGITFKLDRSNVNADQMFVFVDEHKMNQVLRNLLSNAMKFTPRGGVVEVKLQYIAADKRDAVLSKLMTSLKKSISSKDSYESHKHSNPSSRLLKNDTFKQLSKFFTSQSSVDAKPVTLQSNTPLHHVVSGYRGCGTILVSVVDSGPGVNEEDQRKLFQEYVQINPGELQKGQGTGLGLSISKSIVHLHGGNIGMSSEGSGKGSTFYIELPAYYKPRDDTLSGLYDTVLDHSRIFGGSTRIKRSHSRRSFGADSNSHNSVDGAFSFSRSNSGHHHSPIRTNVERLESFFSMGSKKQPKHFAGDSIVAHPLNGCDKLVVPADTEDQRDIEQGIVIRNKPSPQSETVTTSATGTDAGYFNSMFATIGLARDTKYHSKVVPDTAVTRSPRSPLGTSPMTEEATIAAVEAVKAASPLEAHLDNRITAPEETVSSLPVRVHHRHSICVPSKAYRILVVDDSTPNRKMLSRLLSREHHIVTEASDGKEAVEIVRQSIRNDLLFDLILMDYYMPNMIGPDAIEEIRKLGFNGMILGVSGVMDDDVHRFVQAGANLVLCKPIALTAMWKALRSTGFFNEQPYQQKI